MCLAIKLQVGTLEVRITAKHCVSLKITFHYNLDSKTICILQQCSLTHVLSQLHTTFTRLQSEQFMITIFDYLVVLHGRDKSS